MYQNNMCVNCGKEYGSTDATQKLCHACVLGRAAIMSAKVDPTHTPKSLQENVRTMAREIFIRAVVVELPKCNTGQSIINSIANASIRASEEYFKVEDNV